MNALRLHILVTLLLGLFLTTAQARTVSWSSSAFDQLYDSKGNSLDHSFHFEFGTFINDFTPNGSNLGDWNSNWIVFDHAFHDDRQNEPATGGWNVEAQYFAGAGQILRDGTSTSPYATAGAVFPEHSQAYMWIYDSKDLELSPEWALVTDLVQKGNLGEHWKFPGHNHYLMPTMTLGLADADTAIVGAIKSGSIAGEGRVIQSPLEFSLQTYEVGNTASLSPDPTFVPSASFAFAVPEPGGLLLVLAGSLVMLLRRSRYSTPARAFESSGY